MKKIIILLLLCNKLWGQTGISREDSLLFFSLIPLTSQYLLQGTLNIDTLEKICPVDSVIDDFFGLTAGRMDNAELRWLIEPRLPSDSMYVAFIPQRSMPCSTAVKIFGEEKTFVHPARKLWIAQAASVARMTDLQYAITCSEDHVLLLIVKSIHEGCPSGAIGKPASTTQPRKNRK